MAFAEAFGPVLVEPRQPCFAVLEAFSSLLVSVVAELERKRLWTASRAMFHDGATDVFNIGSSRTDLGRRWRRPI
jgi:hypothetical protein